MSSKESNKRIYPSTGEQKNHSISVVGVILLCVVLFKIENKRKEEK
ncbi:LPXTG cell wall anchor domain-containing protein [Enterococcus faecalis]|nr:LPXTG cell wall anchor domain-containing protein [Enterococcus faecalis]ELT8948091.1 LPXTG cell wall anchor domain-containing protein [Enterococcus faecalis]MRJ30694.1 LPXTG cell wall anchor domain-containing protein [Enterococcus faecalis]